MKKQIVALLSVCITTLSLLWAAPVSASVLTTPWQSQSYNFATFNQSANLSFNGFNSSLGSLIGVIIEFTLTESLKDQLYNFNDAPVAVGTPVSDSATVTVSVTGPHGLSNVNVLSTSSFHGIAPVGLSTAGSASLTNFLVGPEKLSGNPISLASYIGGTDIVAINVSDFGTQSGSLAPNVLTSYSGSANGIVSLQYEYETPEPAAIALFALGLLILSQWRRRKG